MNLYHSQNCQKSFGFPIVAAEVEEEFFFFLTCLLILKLISKGM